MYNPDNEQQDACDFLNLILDNCHEELKHLYQAQSLKQTEDEW